MDRYNWHTHTMECYPAIKRTGFLVHATTQLNYETLSEKNQTQKVTCCMSPLILIIPRGGKSVDGENRFVAATGCEGGGRGVTSYWVWAFPLV